MARRLDALLTRPPHPTVAVEPPAALDSLRVPAPVLDEHRGRPHLALGRAAHFYCVSLRHAGAVPCEARVGPDGADPQRNLHRLRRLLDLDQGDEGAVRLDQRGSPGDREVRRGRFVVAVTDERVEDGVWPVAGGEGDEGDEERHLCIYGASLKSDVSTECDSVWSRGGTCQTMRNVGS